MEQTQLTNVTSDKDGRTISSPITKKDFMILISVKDYNPNGDPAADGAPRVDYRGRGLITGQCIKRKIRNWLHHEGYNILYLLDSDMRGMAGNPKCIADIAKPVLENISDRKEFFDRANAEFFDVRAFGAVFSYAKNFAIRDERMHVTGPVCISDARSVDPIEIKIGEPQKKKPNRGIRSNDRVKYGLYLCKGSISGYQASLTKLSDQDVEVLKQAILHMLDYYSKLNRKGSVKLEKVIFWDHNCRDGQYNSATVYNTVEIKHKDGVSKPEKTSDYDVIVHKLPGLEPQILLDNMG